MFEDLVDRINALLARQSVVIVAISGHGGSGKSTLAQRLGAHFGVRNEQIIRMDGLYAKGYLGAQEIFALHDWPTLLTVLSTIRDSERLRYLKRNDQEVETRIDVARPNVVIVGGIRLLRAETVPYFDLSVWIDCPLDLAAERAKERNRQQGDSEVELALWDTKWIPEARQYEARANPAAIANFRYTDYC
jgi:uridine kinase